MSIINIEAAAWLLFAAISISPSHLYTINLAPKGGLL